MSLHQCANGGIDDGVDHLQCYEGWISGNANAQKSAFLEAEYLPYRAVLGGLMVGHQYTYSFSWDTHKGELHAIDYIGTYNATVLNADACQGLDAAFCAGTVSAVPMPPDPELLGLIVQDAGDFTLFGGTIDSVGPYFDPDGPDAKVRAISVTFTPHQATVVLAWAGHISSPLDWVGETTASGISGSPYHVSNISLKKGDAVVANGGRDVSLSAAAVYVPSSISVQKTSNKDGTFHFESYFGQTPIPPEGETNPWTLNRNEQKTVMAFDDGQVSISEVQLPAGDWRVKTITCSKLGEDQNPVFSYQYGQQQETSTASFNVSEGGTYSCTFENEFFGAPVIEVIKKVVGTGDACDADVRNSSEYELRHIRSGESVKYCFWVTNAGTDIALDVTLVDDAGTPGDPADDLTLPLVGGADVGGDPATVDLASGDTAAAELIVEHNVAMNTTVTNTAEAFGHGYTDGMLYSGRDTASVIADQASDCSITASVMSGDSASLAEGCSGGPTMYALEGDTIVWCADVGWDSGAMLDLTDVAVAMMEDSSVSNSNGDLPPGHSEQIMVGTTMAGAADFTGTLQLTGSEGGLNPISCSSPATVDVVKPGLQFEKTVMPAGGTCGIDDQKTLQVIIGDSVQYCLTVANTGDTAITNVWVADQLINVGYAPNAGTAGSGTLEPGEHDVYVSAPFTPSQTMTNTAQATAHEPKTVTSVGPEMSSATVEVLYADVAVDKSVDVPGIVICETPDQNPYCTTLNADGTVDVVYTVLVSNADANTPATDVTFVDTLPIGFVYNGYQTSVGDVCSFSDPELSCQLGHIGIGDTVTVWIYGEVDPGSFTLPWGRLTNHGCANPMPANLDPNGSNNCDDASTSYGTGPTRTIGYWGTHPHAIQNEDLTQPDCQDLGDVDLGFLTMPAVGEGADDLIDATVSTDPGLKGKLRSSLMTARLESDSDADPAPYLEMMLGILSGDTISAWGSGTRRSAIGHSRRKAARQLTASWCNEGLMGSSFAGFLGGWETIREVMAGRGYLDLATGDYVDCDAGGDGACPDHRMGQVIDSIDWYNQVADQYNNSGDHLPSTLPQSPADTNAPRNDPTDPGEQMTLEADSTGAALSVKRVDATSRRGKKN